MADAFVDRFFSELHKDYLKKAGFKKIRRTFVRERADFIERIQFQGSSWNASGEPWRFYINVGVQFRDLPRRKPDNDFPHAHAHGRIERIVNTDGNFFEITEDNYFQKIYLIAALVEQASVALSVHAKEAYESCKNGKLVWFGIT